MQVIERTFSEFLRQPKEVVADLAQHDVVLRRRNAPDLYLSLAAKDISRAKTIECLARLLCKISADSPEAMDDAVESAFPWVEFLSSDGRREFAEELTRIILASASVENFEQVDLTIDSWQNTAEILSDPELTALLTTPITVTDGRRVLPPPAVD
ncbi:hypothetical protein [Candidatus Poriferisocius sp.]|uniref:hypothetical protein n=1 Tax=Candidatus Poriferisocius sp. TaxID=3101276 RepID=UPI003B51D78F